MLEGRIWTGNEEGKRDGILKDDWWVGFGDPRGEIKNEGIYSVKPINIFMEEGGKRAKESNEYNN